MPLTGAFLSIDTIGARVSSTSQSVREAGSANALQVREACARVRLLALDALKSSLITALGNANDPNSASGRESCGRMERCLNTSYRMSGTARALWGAIWCKTGWFRGGLWTELADVVVVKTNLAIGAQSVVALRLGSVSAPT